MLHNKYIYLDWNIIKYMKDPRSGKNEEDNQMKRTVLQLKKKYVFPFSDAHIQDRLNNYSDEHRLDIMDDFSFVSTITNNKALGFNENQELVITEFDALKVIEERIQELTNGKTEPSRISFSFPAIKVDMKKISKDHPMYEFLTQCDGNLTAERMNEFLLYIYNNIFRDSQLYKKFRSFISAQNIREDLSQNTYPIDQIIFLNKLLVHMLPFIDSFSYNEEKLANEWQNIINHWFTYNPTKKTKEELLSLSYGLLDLHPIFHDKLKNNKNTLDNIRRDGLHCMFASQACFFVSEDMYTRCKAAFLYKAFGITTKVVSESEFLNIFNVL